MAITADERGVMSARVQYPAPARLGRVQLLAWCTLGVALFAALVFWFDPGRLVNSLGDTDDATRLIEVRELLSGAPWFDMSLPRFGGAHPLISHWSRLIDLPIGSLLSGFELVLPADKAELAVRALWPLIVLLAFVYLLARESEIRGGRAAALISIVLTVTCIIGIVQFLPGRIDHHNAIILGTVIGIFLLARSFDDPSAGWGAGVMLGIATAIGYEALALTAATLAAAMLFGALPGRSMLGPSRAAVTFAATLATTLALTTSASALFVSHCDVLSWNLVLLAGLSAFGVTIIQAFEDRLGVPAKIGLLAATGAIASSAFFLAEPACLAGPFGQVDPKVIPIWLGDVSETQSMLSLGKQLPMLVGMALIYFAAGAYCGLRLTATDRDQGLRFLLLAFFIAIPLSLWQIKLLPYATFLPIPMIAASLGRPPKHEQKPITRRGIALITLITLVGAGIGGWLVLVVAAPSSSRMKEALKPVQDCQSTPAVAALAELPKGLVVADVNLGPYIVALTDLDVLSAPYHRLDKSIIEAHQVLHDAPADAERRLRNIGARYVVTCAGLDSTTVQGKPNPDALQTLLFADKPPAFLAPVPMPASTPLKVWRVVD